MSETVTHECFRSKQAPNDLLFCVPEDTSCWDGDEKQGKNRETPPYTHRKYKVVVYNRSVWGMEFCGRERERERKHKNREMHEIAWGGVEFSPEPQLTQTQKKLHCKHANLGFSFGTISLVSARAFFQNIGHWFAVKKESRILLFPPRTTHPRYLSELCALERCTTQSVPHLDSFSFEDDWKMVPPNQPAF